MKLHYIKHNTEYNTLFTQFWPLICRDFNGILLIDKKVEINTQILFPH